MARAQWQNLDLEAMMNARNARLREMGGPAATTSGNAGAFPVPFGAVQVRTPNPPRLMPRNASMSQYTTLGEGDLGLFGPTSRR